MCGILGVVGPEPKESLVAAVQNALRTLEHRGPDASAVRRLTGTSGAACFLGHTRLRIIDLDPRADQPMANEDGTVWVGYNGEIYNFAELRAELNARGHTFRSNADTEVLVHLYEECRDHPVKMLAQLRGMFAFIVFDTKSNRLLLARDRLGIKPMYWSEVMGGIAFASEVRALAAAGFVSGEVDLAAVRHYLGWGVVPGPGTILAGAHELPPGCLLEWRPNGHRIEQWWQAEPRPEPRLAGDATALLRGALVDSMSRHVVADRPVGLFLSGGVDSGSVVALAAREGIVRSLTVTFPEAADDEGPAASLVARRLGAEHEMVPVTGREIAAALPEILRAMDQPTSDGINTWIVCRAARDAGLVVALSGLGGDELFGGYASARLVPRLARLKRALDVVPIGLRARSARTLSHWSPGGRMVRTLTSPPGYSGAYEAVRRLLSEVELGADVSSATAAHDDEASSEVHPQDRVMMLEMSHYLRNQLLRDTDQMSMSHSLEVRVPLLDDIVVRFALRLPAEVRVERGKALLARAAGFDDVVSKRPFALPFDGWMRDALRETVREALLSEELPFRDLVPNSLRRRLWETFEGHKTHWSRPWAVTVLRLWPQANGFRW